MPTTQPKILEIVEGKSIETEFPVRNFRFEYTLRGCSLNSGRIGNGKYSWISVVFQVCCLLVDSVNNEFLTCER